MGRSGKEKTPWENIRQKNYKEPDSKLTHH